MLAGLDLVLSSRELQGSIDSMNPDSSTRFFISNILDPASAVMVPVSFYYFQPKRLDFAIISLYNDTA